jgi:serine/threonine-protein kinase
MNEGPMPPARALTIARDLCAIVAAAHDQGVVHGDLKPGNVMLRAAQRRNVTDRWQEPKDDLVILDFGAATAIDIKGPDVRVGSVRYMAPELFEADTDAHRPTAQTDVWALGVIAYGCLTGRYPFDGSSDREVAEAARRSTPTPPSHHRPELDAVVDDTVLKALARDRPARYPDCRAFKLALNQALGEQVRPGLWQRLLRLWR